MEGVALRTEFPEDYGLREEWLNSFDGKRADVPLTLLDHDANRRLWQDIELERALDYHPVHEVHATNLPDYHYWPSIMNDLDAKTKVMTGLRFRYHRDKTEVPRFHRNGTPKTPLHEQPYYIPLTQDGRFDWRANIEKNGIPGAICSVNGWNKRYMRMAYRSQFAMKNSGRWNMIYWPEYLGRHTQLKPVTKLVRTAKGSFIAYPWMFAVCWIGFVSGIWSGYGSASYASLNFNNHPWNPDIHYLQMMHNNGMIHSHYRD